MKPEQVDNIIDDRKQISLKVSNEIYDQLAKIASDTDDTISHTIRLAIKDYIKKYEGNN